MAGRTDKVVAFSFRDESTEMVGDDGELGKIRRFINPTYMFGFLNI